MTDMEVKVVSIERLSMIKSLVEERSATRSMKSTNEDQLCKIMALITKTSVFKLLGMIDLST